MEERGETLGRGNGISGIDGSALDFWLIKRYARHKVIRRCIASYSAIGAGRGDGRESHYEATCCGGEDSVRGCR